MWTFGENFVKNEQISVKKEGIYLCFIQGDRYLLTKVKIRFLDLVTNVKKKKKKKHFMHLTTLERKQKKCEKLQIFRKEFFSQIRLRIIANH